MINTNLSGPAYKSVCLMDLSTQTIVYANFFDSWMATR